MTIRSFNIISGILPEPVVLITNRGEILSANQPFKKIFSRNDGDLKGGSLFDFTINADEKLKSFLQTCSRNRQMTIGRFDFTGRDDQSREYRCEGVLLEPAGEDNPTIIFLRLQPKEKADVRFSLLTEKINSLNREIRERKKAEERNERLYQKALQASRLKDEFLAVVSHELRTPLNSILGWTRILKTGGVESNTFAKALETIDRNARLQVQLIEDILDVSRIITGKLNLDLRPTDLGSVIEAAVEAVRPMAGNKGIFLKTDFDPAVERIAGDGKRIQQMVYNLLSNAIKFTPPGGRVEVGIKNEDSHRVSITVGDTGEGISEEFLPYVFERFLQADASKTRKHGGLGLGLAIVRHLAELHGGSVRVESEGAGKGSVFTILLPGKVSEDERDAFEKGRKSSAQADSENRTKLEYPCLKDLRILIVDDTPDTLELLKIILEKYGARIETASSAAEAFEKLSAGKFHLLISDIAMPGEDGFSLIKRIRRFPDESVGRIPAVALTAHARKKDRRQALSDGFDSFLTKPVEPVNLIRAVEQLLRPAKISN